MTRRLHIHVSTRDMEQSIAFYSALFGDGPIIRERDYAKWMLDDPRVNFAVSRRSPVPGIDHLGIQVDDDAELDTSNQQLIEAGLAVRKSPGSGCCYARSNKHWTRDPQGVAWEVFHTLGRIPVYRDRGVAATVAARCRVSALAWSRRPRCC